MNVYNMYKSLNYNILVSYWAVSISPNLSKYNKNTHLFYDFCYHIMYMYFYRFNAV